MPLHEKLEVFYCIFEVTTPYVTQRQEMEAPRIMLEQRFIALVEQAAASNEPIKVAIRRPIPIWSQFDQRWLNREASIVFKNNAYVAKYGEND